MRVLAVDPGRATGVCVYEDDRIVYIGTIRKDHFEAFDRLLRRFRPERVVIERQFRNRAASEMAGGYFALAAVRRCRPVWVEPHAWQGRSAGGRRIWSKTLSVQLAAQRWHIQPNNHHEADALWIALWASKEGE